MILVFLKIKTQFPIDDRPKKFAEHECSMLKGLNLTHKAAIENLQPYNGCTWTKMLRILSNPDKHRTLTPRGSVFIAEVINESGQPVGIIPNSRTIRQANRPDGAQVQVELVGSIDITVPVAIHHSGVPIGEVVEIAATHLISNVRDLLETFKPEFK
jgi:hypothetical protein